jgi:hypothetical protein
MLPTSLTTELAIADGFVIPCPSGSYRVGRGESTGI